MRSFLSLLICVLINICFGDGVIPRYPSLIFMIFPMFLISYYSYMPRIYD